MNTPCKPKPAATPDRTVRVFVSSTFRDMPFDCAQGRHAERDDPNAEWRMRIAEFSLGEQS
jgi:hypothetical protein